jgi:hypothetical protein
MKALSTTESVLEKVVLASLLCKLHRAMIRMRNNISEIQTVPWVYQKAKLYH